MELKANTVAELQSMIHESVSIQICAGGSKPALSTLREGNTLVDISAISGMIEYEPAEFTFTAWAGSSIEKINRELDARQQFLPFDPPLLQRGATLGGTVAAGLSGPGRYHYGGVRDFVLGVKYVNSNGEIVTGGGKVVKNAAGFDLPKLMVGSQGSYGAIIELTVKVLPRPEAHATLRIQLRSLESVLETQSKLFACPLDIDSIDLDLSGDEIVLLLRMGGFAEVLKDRMKRLRELIGAGEVLSGSDEENLWVKLREMEWVPDGWSLIKIPLTPGRIKAFEAELSRLYPGQLVKRWYSCGGQVGWVAVQESLQMMNGLLEDQGLSGLVLLGPAGKTKLGIDVGSGFRRRVKQALDPINKFVEL